MHHLFPAAVIAFALPAIADPQPSWNDTEAKARIATFDNDGPRPGLLAHHADAAREYAHDRDSHIGQLLRGLDEGPDRGWLIIDMAQDWNRVWPTPQ